MATMQKIKYSDKEKGRIEEAVKRLSLNLDSRVLRVDYENNGVPISTSKSSPGELI